MTNKDGWMGNSLSKKPVREHVTPYKISVVILIQEYCNIKSEAIRQTKNKSEEGSSEEIVKILEPIHRRDFSMLVLHLIQCPDMDFTDFLNLLESEKYKLVPNLLKNFLAEIDRIIQKEVGSIMDVILDLGKLLIDPINLTPIVNKNSPVGIYLRRVMLYFDKLNFSHTVSLYRGFQHYVMLGKQKWASKHPCEQQYPALEPLVSPQPSVSLMDSVNMELSSVEQILPPPISLAQEMEKIKVGDDMNGEEVPALWSRRQVELFVARQTTWLQNNESCAMSPPQLQEVIRQLLKANPDHFEGHYLSYLNCARVKELSGALDSMYHFFDRNTMSSQDKEAKGYRYAALNLAILHAQFGHKSEALAALKEAIFLSHEVNDSICLQHAQAWLYKLTDDNKEILMERSISKCSDLSLNYLTSLGLQSFAQFAGTTGGKPSLVFEVLMRSDVLNCQFSLMDLVAHSFAHKAALWTLYGKADMASLSSQLLLHMQRADSLRGHNGEATCQAMCNIALRLTDLGDYDLAIVVVERAKDNFFQYSSWKVAEQVLYFTRSLYHGQWQAAHTAIRQLSTLNKWEALLRKGELLLTQRDNAGALAAVTKVLDEGPSLCPSLRVRALLLAARGSEAATVSILTAALSIANYHYLDYLTALVAIELAQVQLQMKLPNQAMKLMDQSMLVVLSHGGSYDQASAMLLFVQCKVASVATAKPDRRTEVINDAIKMLVKVKDNFRHVEAYSKVKEAVYIQCLLYNELGCYAERNKYSYEFRQLDEEFPTLV